MRKKGPRKRSLSLDELSQRNVWKMSVPTYFERSLSNWVPQSDQQPFKIAFYNTAALVFLAAAITLITAVYHLLQAFFRPMIWAVLCGTVLFPFKKTLAAGIESWLTNLKSSSTPFLLGLALIPIHILDYSAENLWRIISSKDVMIFISVYAIIVALAYQNGFSILLSIFMRLYSFLDVFIMVGSNKWVLIITFVYFLVFIGYLYAVNADASKFHARLMSVPIWIVVLCTVSSVIHPLRVFVFLGSSIVILLIVFGVLHGSTTADSATASPGHKSDDAKSSETDESGSDRPKKPSQPPHETSLGNRYIQMVLGACCLVWVTNSPVVLSIFMVVLLYAMMKKLGEYFGVWAMIFDAIRSILKFLHEKFRRVLEIVVPSSIRQFAKIIYYGDQQVIDSFINCAGILSSVFVMVGLLLGSILFSIFFVVQVRSEVAHLVQLTSSVLNQTIQANADWVSNATSSSIGGIDKNFDSMVADAYQYGRTYLSAQARLLAKPDDKEKADMLEEQVKLLIDRLYELYLARSQEAPKVTSASSSTDKHAITDVFAHLKHTTDISLLANELVELVKENVGTLLSVADTIWTVLSANIQFVFSILATIFGTVLDLGMDVLNFFIGILVFMTMIYYLLALSKDEWKPIEWLMMLMPSSNTQGKGSFSLAVQQAISGVFILSCKMAVFYGLYSYFIHTLFMLNVVFVPSILAAVFAAIPFLAPYWVFAPGAVELLLVRGEPVAAAMFFACSLAPMMLVDAVFYKEVKGSHPYLTGLSVVGGLYWLGLEGALIGPMLLCCLLVMLKMYRTLVPQ